MPLKIWTKCGNSSAFVFLPSEDICQKLFWNYFWHRLKKTHTWFRMFLMLLWISMAQNTDCFRWYLTYCVNYNFTKHYGNTIMHVQKCGSTMVLLCAILLQHLQQTTSQTHVKDVYWLCALQNTLDSDVILFF